jgi:nanoRNase/pAp phosphatase (c-di-AMP/oligoRNAs hydrolase)
MRTIPASKTRVNIPPGSRVFCISHRDDADGLASAALVKCATGCDFALANYDDIDTVLTDVPSGLDWLVVTDLGLDEKRGLIDDLLALARRTLYVDHHRLSAQTGRRLRRGNVVVCHSLHDCASVLVWDSFRKHLPDKAMNLAAYGAVTDPPVSGFLTREVMVKTSWNLIGYEGHLLALALSSDRCTNGLRKEVVRRLTSLQMPHQITAVRRLADEQASRMTATQKSLYNRAKVKRQVAIAQAGKLALGTSAELLLGIPNVIASAVHDSAGSSSRTRVSVRGTDQCRRHLGKLILRTARKVGGAGGGHMLAAGAVIPTSRLEEFLGLLVKDIRPGRLRARQA